jgi:LAS superfamily LD-carboxypeptidase LdcB
MNDFQSDNLLKSMSDLMSQSTDSKMMGGKNLKKKVIPKKTPQKKVKEIDTYKKPQLEKIAKKHDVNLKTREGKVKTKKQLFDSLKRKELV